MYCAQCGNELKDGAKFCGVCGHPTGVLASQQQSGQSPQYGQPSQYGQTPQYSLTPQNNQPPQYVQTPQYNQTSQNNQPPQYGQAAPVPHTPKPSPNNTEHFTPPSADQAKSWFTANVKCTPAFVLGLIAGLFGILGGYCMTTCGAAMSSTLSNLNFFMILLPSIIGLVGACLCFKYAHIGSLLMLIPGVTILIKGWFMYGGADFQSIFAMLLFWIAGIVGLAMTRQPK